VIRQGFDKMIPVWHARLGTAAYMGAPESSVRFGTFEVDLDAAELRKRGLKIRLPEQAFQVLTTLLGDQARW
jgi:hypothetical protein